MLLSNKANAQNVFPDTGYVGIGVLNPQYQLDVNGNVRISQNLYVGGGIIISDKVNATTSVETATLKSASIQADSILMDSTKAFYGYSKFVGDVKLENKLKVNGDVQVNGNINTPGNISSNAIISNSIQTSQLTISEGTFTTDTLHAIKQVIVNNSLKIAKEDINNFAEVSTKDTAVTLVLQKEEAAQVVIGSSTTQPAPPLPGQPKDKLIVIGNTQLQGDVNVSGNLKITGGSPAINKVLTSNAEGLASWQLLTSAWELLGNSGTDPALNFIGTTDAKALAFRTDNTERMIILQDGRIGIGTNTNLTEKLNVNGGQWPSYTKMENDNGWTKIGFNGAHGIIESDHAIFLNYYSGNDFIVGGTTGNFKAVNNVFLATNLNTNVGVGTINPGAKLEIDGQIKITQGNPGLGYVLTSDANGLASWQTLNTSTWQLTGNSGTNPATNFIGTTDAKALAFRTDNTERMIILQDGRIGIGTNTNLTEKLNVNGGQWPSYTKMENDNGWTKIGFNGAHGIIESDHAIFLNYYSGNDFIVGGTTGNFKAVNNVFLATNLNTNVGVGTINPGAKLEINGQIKITQGNPGLGYVLTSDANGLASWQTLNTSAWQLTGNSGTNPATNFIGTTDAKALAFRTDNTERMIILHDGRIGIGTNTNLTEKLNVNGGQWPSYTKMENDNGWTKIGFNGAHGIIESDHAIFLNYYSGNDFIVGGTTGNFKAVNNVYLATHSNTKVGIGTETLDANSILTVNGKIYAEEIEVVQQVLPDYVFEKDYSLMTLKELENYIDSCKHLPEVPSAVFVKNNGLQLGEFNTLLLKKVEELTLYLIQIEKDNIALKERISKLENK